MKVENIIKIIESCKTYLQLETAKNFIDNIELDSKEDCEKVKISLDKKETQFTNKLK